MTYSEEADQRSSEIIEIVKLDSFLKIKTLIFPPKYWLPSHRIVLKLVGWM